MVKDKFNRDVPYWVARRIQELAVIDPSSTAFRYGKNWNSSIKKDVPVPGELHVRLEHLQMIMTALHDTIGSIPASSCQQAVEI